MAHEASASASVTRPVEAAFELKGAVSPLTVLRLRTDDLGAIEADLWDRVEQAPGLLLNAPVVVDVGALENEGRALDFDRLVAALRRCQVVPVAVANLPAELRPRAAGSGLGSIPLGPTRRRATTQSPAPAPQPAAVEVAPPGPAAEAPPPAAEPVAAPAAEPVAEAAPAVETIADEAPAEPVEAPAPVLTTTIRTPVRGGQVVYARSGDLVVTAAVNPGAQVIADGHIHVYGRLRGRALAGAGGNPEARIFCQALAAELVSINGEYLTADEIPEALRGKPAQIYLKDGRCVVAPL